MWYHTIWCDGNIYTGSLSSERYSDNICLATDKICLATDPPKLMPWLVRNTRLSMKHISLPIRNTPQMMLLYAHHPPLFSWIYLCMKLWACWYALKWSFVSWTRIFKALVSKLVGNSTTRLKSCPVIHCTRLRVVPEPTAFVCRSEKFFEVGTYATSENPISWTSLL